MSRSTTTLQLADQLPRRVIPPRPRPCRRAANLALGREGRARVTYATPLSTTRAPGLEAPEAQGDRASSDEGGRPFGIYVHMPFCRRRCDYCAFATWTDRDHLWERYIAACRAEVEGLAGPPPAAGALETSATVTLRTGTNRPGTDHRVRADRHSRPGDVGFFWRGNAVAVAGRPAGRHHRRAVRGERRDSRRRRGHGGVQPRDGHARQAGAIQGQRGDQAFFRCSVHGPARARVAGPPPRPGFRQASGRAGRGGRLRGRPTTSTSYLGQRGRRWRTGGVRSTPSWPSNRGLLISTRTP